MNRLIKISLFSIHVLSALGLFFYLLFPSDAVQRYMASRVERTYPGIRLSFSRLQPTLPFGLSIASSQLFFHDTPLVRADTIQINPHLDSLFRPPKKIAFQGNTCGGRFDGTILLAKSDPAVQVQVDTGLTGVRIEKIPFFQHLKIDGLSGVGDCRIRSGVDGSLAVRLKISECKGSFPASFGTDSILGTEPLSFQRVLATLDYRKGELVISEMLFEGDRINGSLRGAVTIKEPIGKSLLKLGGKISTDRRHPAGLDEQASMRLLSGKNPSAANFDFKIEGTLEDPVFSFPGRS